MYEYWKPTLKKTEDVKKSCIRGWKSSCPISETGETVDESCNAQMYILVAFMKTDLHSYSIARHSCGNTVYLWHFRGIKKKENTLIWRLFKCITHGSLGQQECCSTSQESVGGGRSHPKCWGICRERLQCWKSPPVTKCDNILVGIVPMQLSAQASQDAGCKHVCAALNNKQWAMNSFTHSHHNQ